MSTIGRVVVGVCLVVLWILRLAFGIVLSFVAPIVMPFLVLLSGGGLVVTLGFAIAGDWQNALKGLVACVVCSSVLAVFAGLVQLVNPYVFSVPVVVSNRNVGC